MITMIFLSLSAARHGVESSSAILLWRASCSRRSDSSSCENLNPCAASVGPDATWTSNTRVARANRGRISSKGRVLEGQRASTSPGRLAEREPEIYRTIRHGAAGNKATRRAAARSARAGPYLIQPVQPSQAVTFCLKKAIVRDQASLAAASSYRGVVSLWKPWLVFGYMYI